MNQGISPAGGGPGRPDPYHRLGIDHSASFEAVQQARDRRLEEAGDDPLARATVEAAYDAVLMDRLKERQQGKVSSAARSASQREQGATSTGRLALPSLPPGPSLPTPRLSVSAPRLPVLSLAEGRERWFPFTALGTLLILLIVVPAAPADLLLALATAATVLNLQRRHGRFLAAIGWSLLLLIVGLLIGRLLLQLPLLQASSALPITGLQLQSLPALLLLLAGALLLA